MYKKTEKKIIFLLDRALAEIETEINTFTKMKIGSISREISILLREKRDVLNEDMVQKLLQIIAINNLSEARNDFINLLASKEYAYISQELVKFLSFDDLIFSAYIIHALYKMDTVSYYNEILPFSAFEELQFLHDKANQYLKRAGSRLEKK